MPDIPLDDRGLAVETIFTNARAQIEGIEIENLEALAFLGMRKEPFASFCEFGGRPAVMLMAAAELMFECLKKVEPDQTKRQALMREPFGDVLVSVAKQADGAS